MVTKKVMPLTPTQLAFCNGYKAWVNGLDLVEVQSLHAKAGWQAAADHNANGGGARPTLDDALFAAADYDVDAPATVAATALAKLAKAREAVSKYGVDARHAATELTLAEFDALLKHQVKPAFPSTTVSEADARQQLVDELVVVDAHTAETKDAIDTLLAAGRAGGALNLRDRAVAVLREMRACHEDHGRFAERDALTAAIAEVRTLPVSS